MHAVDSVAIRDHSCQVARRRGSLSLFPALPSPPLPPADLGSSFWGMVFIVSSTNKWSSAVVAASLCISLIVFLVMADNVRAAAAAWWREGGGRGWAHSAAQGEWGWEGGRGTGRKGGGRRIRLPWKQSSSPLSSSISFTKGLPFCAPSMSTAEHAPFPLHWLPSPLRSPLLPRVRDHKCGAPALPCRPLHRCVARQAVLGSLMACAHCPVRRCSMESHDATVLHCSGKSEVPFFSNPLHPPPSLSLSFTLSSSHYS